MYAPAPLWLATIVVALTGLAALSPMGAAAARGGNDRVPVVELPLTQAQVNANMAKLVASIEEQIDALRSMLAVRVGPDADYVKRQQAPTNVTDLPPAANCTDLTCDVLDPSREAVVLASAEANAVANGLPSYVGSVMYGNYCMLYVSKRLEVEYLNAAYNANLTMPIQHADNFTSTI
ncbi:uncharacterized protein ACA1_058390 [Acanthamoeba castellanii str. Neff]|uniref:Uncharacterized protein n=1 Tax=Acanthamoeba castellanii (strain ATCC 30010 / Neff) TaxID=1257118 RepID=L8GX90_ACACF|nr:uncharacterized protein ACA1_058390 [Acanthamoeba castellanii str. Neff]ELR17183.1 hypothetical protein ACA1_058390 [Acanthamoeba castellanii str. Neff]